MVIDIPEFRAPIFLSGGHRQTLIPYLFSASSLPYRAQQHMFAVPGGDELALHDDQPEGWQPGDPIALLMHGLSGCHRSSYMIRIANKLNQRGLRVFRMDHRGCGAVAEKCRLPYHAGIVQDAQAAWDFIRELCPGSPGGVVGFSLSGNVTLKAAGTIWSRSNHAPACAVAVNAPIDLEMCSQALSRRGNRIYENHFVKLLISQVEQRIAEFADAPRPRWQTPPTRLREFDDLYTAPASGYKNANDYYNRASSNADIGQIDIPTFVLTSRDDPMVPVLAYEKLELPESVRLHIAPSGGHLGYFAKAGSDPDRRWMDWRVVDWVTAHCCRKEMSRKPHFNSAVRRVAVSSE